MPGLRPTARNPKAPRAPGRPVHEIPIGARGTSPPRRMSWDGTVNFCQSCDTPLSSNAARFCERHTEQRRRFRNRKTEPHLYVVSPEAITGLQALYDAALVMERQIGRATTQYRHADGVPRWVDDLMGSVKDVLHGVHVHLAPTFDLTDPSAGASATSPGPRNRSEEVGQGRQ